MKKNKNGNIFDIVALIIAFASLFFNIILLYNIKNNTLKPNNNSVKEYTKKELGEYFKYYQSTNNLAYPDKIVLWDVNNITYRGFFKNTSKKLYYIEEKYTCVSGDSCITASGVSKDKEYSYSATFVVSIDFNDPYDLKFEILDYSIENSSDFIQDEIYDLK